MQTTSIATDNSGFTPTTQSSRAPRLVEEGATGPSWDSERRVCGPGRPTAEVYKRWFRRFHPFALAAERVFVEQIFDPDRARRYDRVDGIWRDNQRRSLDWGADLDCGSISPFLGCPVR